MSFLYVHNFRDKKVLVTKKMAWNLFNPKLIKKPKSFPSTQKLFDKKCSSLKNQKFERRSAFYKNLFCFTTLLIFYYYFFFIWYWFQCLKDIISFILGHYITLVENFEFRGAFLSKFDLEVISFRLGYFFCWI